MLSRSSLVVVENLLILAGILSAVHAGIPSQSVRLCSERQETQINCSGNQRINIVDVQLFGNCTNQDLLSCPFSEGYEQIITCHPFIKRVNTHCLRAQSCRITYDELIDSHNQTSFTEYHDCGRTLVPAAEIIFTCTEQIIAKVESNCSIAISAATASAEQSVKHSPQITNNPDGPVDSSIQMGEDESLLMINNEIIDKNTTNLNLTDTGETIPDQTVMMIVTISCLGFFIIMISSISAVVFIFRKKRRRKTPHRSAYERTIFTDTEGDYTVMSYGSSASSPPSNMAASRNSFILSNNNKNGETDLVKDTQRPHNMLTFIDSTGLYDHVMGQCADSQPDLYSLSNHSQEDELPITGEYNQASGNSRNTFPM